jgi:hypothetical protein
MRRRSGAHRIRSAYPLFFSFFADQAPQKGEIFLLAIRREVEGGRDLPQLLLLDSFLVPLHEALICPPRNPHGFDRIAFGANSDLMRMEVMQAQFVEQRFLYDLMRQQEWF